MITSLITGGAGFIGSHVAKSCLLSGHEVIIIDDLSGGFESNIPDKAIFIKGTICDLNLLQKVFESYKIHYVYHLAAFAAENLSHFIRRFNYINNLVGSVNLINLSLIHDVKCFVFTSSIAVYGQELSPVVEKTRPNPTDPYGIAKYAVELDLLAANQMFGLNYIVFRPHNVYGENQNIGDRYRNVIGIFMNQIIEEKPMTVFGSGEQTRAFSYINDIAPTIANSVKFKNAYNQVFNIGADSPYSINFIANIVAKEFGVKPSIKYLKQRKEATHMYSDHSKAKKLFGALEDTNIEQGIRNMAEWVKSTKPAQSVKFEIIELQKYFSNTWDT